MDLLKQAVGLIEEASREAAKSCPSAAYRHSSIFTDFSRTDWYHLDPINSYTGREGKTGAEEILEKARTNIDRAAWGHLRDALGIKNLMDAQALKEYNEVMYYSKDAVPVFNEESAFATFSELYENRQRMFVRGLVNVFRGLNTSWYKSNSAFCLTPKIVMSSAVSDFGSRYGGSLNTSNNVSSQLSDLDRIFHILDEKTPLDHLCDASSAVSLAANRGHANIETEYFHFKLHKNGNLHVIFKRVDLVEKANKLIAQYFKDMLGDDRKKK